MRELQGPQAPSIRLREPGHAQSIQIFSDLHLVHGASKPPAEHVRYPSDPATGERLLRQLESRDWTAEAVTQSGVGLWGYGVDFVTLH
ncbi:hypothetical protein ABT061_28375 [Streptosporangium sp. NPDC002544]|uniref:hypothetical protein n=1 Tax=Streptosporangium sp. NPDC002544 TaxID=3154538 RepID=UPI00331A256B